MANRCLGVLTKVDVEPLQGNTAKAADEYNRDVAKKLRDSLTCADAPQHLNLREWTWVAVLNPNHEEELKVRLPASLLHLDLS